MLNLKHKPMPRDNLEKNNQLLRPETAGRRMILEVPLAKIGETIKEVEEMLLKKIKDFETINYIYIVDDEKRLKGVISIKEIFRSPKTAKVDEFMIKDLISVHPHTDQEKAAILAVKHSLKAVPVVDKENHLLGIIPSDTILDILHSEHIEDFLRLGGIYRLDESATAVIKASVTTLIKARLPWLLLGLLGGMFAAGVVGFFEEALKSQLVLAMFIPLIVYMSGAAAAQTETLFIRSLAIDHSLVIKKYILREIRIALIIALICGLLLSVASFIWWQSFLLGIVLGISMFLAILSAIFVAVFIPWLLAKLEKDPAMGSGPFATIITDILSLIVYFGIASLFF